ncbi:MAG TPA: alpha/beta hydrolase [Dongiaceae bacterium]|nr:alpha/beta hydrolase [Dongiaceae bacterium]
MDHIVWALPARSLAHRGRSVLAIDLPGHGRSEGPALPSIAMMASWVIRLLDAARIQQASLVGHSMGSLISLEAAAQAPARIRRVALLGVAARMPVHPDLLKAAAEDQPHAADLIASWAHGPAGHFGGNPAPGVWRMGGAQRLLNQTEPGVMASDLVACDAYDTAASAARVKCPSLLLLGALDRMTPAAKAKVLATALPDCRTMVIPGAGHMMMSETPDAVIDALLDFI